MLDHSKIDLLKPKKAAWADTKSGVENDSIKANQNKEKMEIR